MRIGLVLSGGGARGFAHIGVLKALEEKGVRISELSGCSMGALIGALYASGIKPRVMERLAIEARPFSIRDVSLSFQGLFKGGRVEEILMRTLPFRTFEELKIPLSINAVDLSNGREVVFRKGNLIKALRASIASPGTFTPIKYSGRILVDGGIINPVPFNNLGRVDYAIMVNTSTRLMKISAKSRIDKIARQSIAIRERSLIELQLKDCRIPYHVIRPNIGAFGYMKFKFVDKIIKAGYIAGKKQMPCLLRKLMKVDEGSISKIINRDA